MRSVSEQIDERILRLLGLEDVFDLDYDTYMTLLKEAIVTGSNKIPQEELALLANERKRIRGKKGRFKAKREKITADKVATTKFLKPSKKTLALPESVSKPDTSQGLIGFGKPLESIAKTLSSILKLRKKTNEDERKDKESQKRTKREETLEGFKKGVSAVSGAARKMLAPFQNIIDRIWRFIFFTLLGRAFTQLMEWLGDPKNKKKIDVLGRFLKDWWPTLLGAAVLFFTPFGKFVRTTLKLVGFLTGRLVGSIPKIAGAIKGLSRVLLNPWVAVPAAAVGLAAAANEVTGQRKAAPIQAQNKARAQTGKGLGVQGVGGVGDMGPTTPYGLLQGAANGGSVMNGYGGIDSSTGQKVSGFGPDTQMIVAQPGEIVINKKTVDAVGADNLLALNRQYGGAGANKPKMGKLYNSGGMVGMQGGGLYSPMMRIMHGTREGVPELIRQNGFRPQTGMLGKGVYGSVKGWVADTYRGAGAFKGILPGQGPRLNMLVPQGARTLRGATAVSADVANRGLSLADRLMAGQYPNSAKAAQLRNMLTAPTPTMGRAVASGVSRMAGRFTGLLNAPVIGDMINPSGTSRFDQLSGPNAYYNAPGYKGPKPQKKQGGGEVMGSITPEEGLRGYEMARKRKELPTWMIEALGKEVYDAKYGPASTGGSGPWRNFKGSGATDMRGNILSKQSGGLIKENTGMNIRGATADRQLTALQPGEYVLPVDTVSRLGTSLIDKLVALTDSNSNAAKLGKRSVNRPNITPLSRSGVGGMMTLPPITQSSGASTAGNSNAGSNVPAFSAVSPSGSAERSMNASIYGIVG